MNFENTQIESPQFCFSASDDQCVSIDKFRGLARFGPYSRIEMPRPPVIAFVFPKQRRDLANKLYMALRNGVGPYKGFNSMFRIPLEKDQVFQISNFEVNESDSLHTSALRYKEAITSWQSTRSTVPDLFVVLHPKSSAWEEDTPYYQCKSLLLRDGYLSQDVTFDLLDNSNQFEWSVANIALGLFVKLGGIPWIINRRAVKNEIVLGVGRTHLFDPKTRDSEKLIAFAMCLRGDGPFEFTTIGTPAHTEKEYHERLAEVITQALQQVKKLHAADTITLHVTKEFGRIESDVINSVVKKHAGEHGIVINVLKITEENDFFLLDEDHKEGVPSRGTSVQIGPSDYLLYTEGREEKLVWRNRLPTGLRVRTYNNAANKGVSRDLLSQVYDLSQVNYRAFNASSKPISIEYSKSVSRLLAHLPDIDCSSIDRQPTTNRPRMWFI